MTYQNLPNDSTNSDRRKRLDVIKVKLRSQRPSDIFGAIIDVKRLLQENIEDHEIYEILLDAVRDNPGLRQEIRNLLEEMIQKGSKSAAGALRVLPADIQDLMSDADDEYYTGDYEKAIELYHRVLAIDPNHVRAKEQIAKAELNRIAGRPDADLPWDAVQHFRRARSYISARDFVNAMKYLDAALEAAKAKGMDFPEAENLLNSMQDLGTADEYKAKADDALKKEQWNTAWDLYSKTALLNPQDQVVKELLEGLDGLMRADALLDSLDAQPNEEKEQKEKLARVDVYLKKAEEIKALVGTSLLKNSRVRYNQCMDQYEDKGFKAFLSSRRTQTAIIAIIALLILILVVVVTLLLIERNQEPSPPPLITATSAPTSKPVTNTPVPNSTDTLIPTMTPTTQPSETPASTIINTATITPTLKPVAVAYGVLKTGTNPVEDTVTFKLIFPRLTPGQVVNILDLTPVIGYYKSSWEINGTPYEGWILKDAITIVQVTPTPGK
jgi:tetratricopeptide (TPR) repeat protein